MECLRHTQFSDVPSTPPVQRIVSDLGLIFRRKTVSLSSDKRTTLISLGMALPLVHGSARESAGVEVSKPCGRPAGVVDTYVIHIICALLFAVRCSIPCSVPPQQVVGAD